MSDLTQRLRSSATVFYEYSADDGALLREAADRVEALEARVTELEHAEVTLGDMLNRQIDKTKEERARVAKLEAALAEVDQLSRRISARNQGMFVGDGDDIRTIRIVTRAALAAEGKDDGERRRLAIEAALAAEKGEAHE